jgi:hypothetical protein
LTPADTGGWQTWRNLVKTGISLAAGQRTVRLVFDTAASQTGSIANINYLAFTSGSSGTPTPYGGVPAAVPGIVQAEHFDAGGQNVAYRDTTSGNSGGAFRNTDVDIAVTNDTGSGYNVGYTRVGEWLNYTVDVATTRMYTVRVRYANIGTGATLHLELDGANITGSLTLQDTGGWQRWRDLSTSVTLPAGTHVLAIVFDTRNQQNVAVGNINYVSIQ